TSHDGLLSVGIPGDATRLPAAGVSLPGSVSIPPGDLRGRFADGAVLVHHEEVTVCDAGRHRLRADEDVHAVVVSPEPPDLHGVEGFRPTQGANHPLADPGTPLVVAPFVLFALPLALLGCRHFSLFPGEKTITPPAGAPKAPFYRTALSIARFKRLQG